jgi:excisionase family DNA binding protein
MDDMRLITVPEVAQRLRISRQRAYTMAQRGELPTVKFGRSVRVRPDALEAWIREHTHDATS